MRDKASWRQNTTRLLTRWEMKRLFSLFIYLFISIIYLFILIICLFFKLFCFLFLFFFDYSEFRIPNSGFRFRFRHSCFSNLPVKDSAKQCILLVLQYTIVSFYRSLLYRVILGYYSIILYPLFHIVTSFSLRVIICKERKPVPSFEILDSNIRSSQPLNQPCFYSV